MTPDDTLHAVLEDARKLGFLGPDRVERHIEHAVSWANALSATETPSAFLDLGSGGGVPGLVFAVRWPQARASLLDSQLRRTAWLRNAIGRLGLTDRVEVIEGRAEVLGHRDDLREQFPLVVARAFGSPAITAEQGSAFVETGGILSVSEPPGSDPDRWPTGPLTALGFGNPLQVVQDGRSFVILPKDSALRDGFPRRHNRSMRDPSW